jgi:hypothetical protein
MKPATNEISIQQLERGWVKATIIGETGIYFNSMSVKAQRDLLMPPKRKSAAERAMTVKHDPRAEFRNSVYFTLDDAPTLIGFPASGIKAAIAAAALDTPGVTKSAIARLVYVDGDVLPIWGVPRLRMDVVRSADISRTPDIRTRAFLPQWVADVEISFARPTLNSSAMAQLVANAGMTVGIGDFRQQKGAGNFGSFRLATEADAELIASIKRDGDRKAQEAAMEVPVPHDRNTAELLAYFDNSMKLRVA